jgi:hypothetical protein
MKPSTRALPPHGRASAGVFDRHLIGHALADKRAVKGVEHAGLDVIEGSRVAVAGRRSSAAISSKMRPGRDRITMMRSASAIASPTS